MMISGKKTRAVERRLARMRREIERVQRAWAVLHAAHRRAVDARYALTEAEWAEVCADIYDEAGERDVYDVLSDLGC